MERSYSPCQREIVLRTGCMRNHYQFVEFLKLLQV